MEKKDEAPGQKWKQTLCQEERMLLGLESKSERDLDNLKFWV